MPDLPDLKATQEPVRDFFFQKLSEWFGQTPIEPEKQFLLPDPLINLIKPPLAKIGFPVEEEPAVVEDHTGADYYFYKIKLDVDYLALLFLYKKMLQYPAESHNLFFMPYAWTKKKPTGKALGMFFFSDSEFIDDAYESVRNYFEGSGGLELVEFFHIKFVEKLFSLGNADRGIDKIASLLEERLKLNTLFHKPCGSTGSIAIDGGSSATKEAVPLLSYKDLKDNQTEVECLEKILAGQADVDGNVVQYLTNKINETAWDSGWKTDRIAKLTAESENSARALILYALQQGKIPNKDNLTALGSLLQNLLKDIGTENCEVIKKIIDKYHLVS